MADDDAVAAAALGTRWTCEACGCHTNTEAEDAISCGVCGTRRAPSLLRRNQSRPLSRNFNPDDSSPSSPSSHSSHSSHSSPSDHSDDDASTSSPIENDDTLVLEAARIADAASPLRHSRAAAARRLLRPGTSGVLLQRHPVRPRSSSRPTTDPETLRTLANGNAGEYLPRWSVRHKGGSIVVDEEDHPHVAHLSEVGEEGRCVRALHPLPAPAARPRHRPGGSPPPAAEGSRKRGVYGWKVVFEHSSRDRGKSMGGCYLVGVTTHAFASFGERSGLQQSRLFWGIEDGGRRYEGGGRRQGAVAGGSPHGIQLNRAEAPRNSDNVLFGSREVVTVVADLEARTLTYWRDGRLLGTLVTGLPRAGSLYPVAVPFNAGVSVAITGLEGDPLGMLSRFHTAQRAALEAKNQARRVTLANQKSLLIENGALTEALANVLREIFGWYGGETLDALAASRLWYRCGLRLSHLSVLLEGRDSVGVEDFMTIIEKIVEEEESGEGRKVDVTEAMDTSSSGGESDVAPFAPTFEVGDKVEVAEGYEKYGDAASGPLRPGDRGSVMEVQRGPRGDRQSVRVVFNGRRWWYQPQALLSERSGLVESPAVRLLLNILRRHGYDSRMKPLWDKPVTAESWKIGDLVVTAPDAPNDDRGWGRIVPDTTAGRRDAGLVMVDFSRSRGGAKRVKVSTLHHTTFHHGRSSLPHPPSPPPSDDESSTSPPPRANAHLLQTIRGVAQLDNTAMTALLSECRTSASLAGLFAAGLPDAILSALDHAGSHEGDVAPRLATLGNLCVAVVTQLFHDGPTSSAMPPAMEDPPVMSPRAENPRTNTTNNNNNNNNDPPPRVNVRDLMRDLGRGAEQRRGVLLALMASARMSDEGRGMDDDHLSRGRHLLSSFGRLSADAAAFGVLPSPPSLPPDDPPGEAVVSGGSLLSSVLRGGSPVAGTTAPPLRRSISSSTKSLINDGLLLDDLHWVKKALHAGADPPTARDDDDTPLLRLAISLGCHPPLLSALIKAGSTVTSRDIETAAVTNQPATLALLLRHAVYTPGRIPWERCSPAIRETLSAAEETQKKQEATMKDAAGDFCQEVLRRFVALALQCALENRKGAARCVAETLVGEVLLSAMHEGQGGSWGGVGGTEDGRVPALDLAEGRSLLEALPEGVVRRALSDEEEESLVTYLRLTEYYMWSKTMRDAAVGLTLAAMLLRKAPGLCDEMTRFGMKELAAHHVTLADENLADLAVGSVCPPVVKCPQGHTTILHLTRHSSFRCDLCGKGVEQNKPMHGCRDCDWDACECCTDKAEGGLVKWSHIRSLAVEVGGMVSEEGDEEQEGEGEELVRVCRAILERDERGVDGLRAMLDVPGRVTLYEFASCVLPSLYFAMVGERNGMRRNDVNLCLMKPTRRRNKKPRVRRVKTSLVKRFDNEGGYFMNYNTFMETCVKALIFSSTSPISDDTPEIPMDTPDDASSTTSTPPPSPHQTTPEVLRRIHTILAFYERAIVTQHTPPTTDAGNSLKSNPPNGGDLQSLLLPLEIDLVPPVAPTTPSIHVEPLMPISTLQQFILRTRRITEPGYQRFCRRLVADRAIIAERPRGVSPPQSRKRARIVGYHDAIGAHVVRYAREEDLREAGMGGWECHGPEVCLILAVRDYVILWREGEGQRNEGEGEVWEETLNEEWDGEVMDDGKGIPVGTRVECDVNEEGMEVFTVISAGEDYERDSVYNTEDEPNNVGDLRYAIVNDEGRVFLDVSGEKLRGYDATLRVNARDRERNVTAREGSSAPLLRGTGHGFFESRGVPLSTRRGNGGTGEGRGGGGANATPTVGVLKRTWSALSPLQNMKPLELSIEGSAISEEGGDGVGGAVGTSGDSSNRRRAMSVGGEDWDVGVDYSGAMAEVEMPPNLSVEFSLSDNIPTISLPNPEETTLFSGLKCLKHLNHLNVGKQSKLRNNIALERRRKLYYTITMSIPPKKSTPHWNKDATSPSLPATFTPPWSHHTPDVPHNSPFSPHMPALLLSNTCTNLNESRFDPSENTPENTENTAIEVSSSPPLSPATPFSPAYTFDPHTTLTHCDGLCPTSVQCLELLEILAEHSLRPSTPTPPPPTLPPLFVSTALTSKLLLQLDDPLTVVSGSLPPWTTIAPTLTPRVFSHTSRSLLLERAAFGVSRAAWHQQEAKVAVGPLRQRMAALRGRAVELVGEAFSGGAADPTALQLQADELYGMEEALAARVSAAFRAQRWDERSLQCAKAAVRREELLNDAGKVMQRYACDGRVNRRRLEVRFEGESGFDAASGEEAGVTRGFYADVAEALLSCEHVCGVFNPSMCGTGMMGDELGRERGVTAVKMRLPLWIPDIDASGKVVIPTPRADSHSVPGVFPRPLASVHPLYGAVLEQFRFMGRLFAAALRDGFIFPLPLSSSFLKLVQTGGGAGVCHPRLHTNDMQKTKNSSRLRSSSSSNSSLASVDYFSNHSNASVSSGSSSPTMKTNMSIEDFCTGSTSNSLVENVNPLVSGSAGRNHVNEPFSPHNNPVSTDSNQSFLLCMAAEQNTPHTEPHSATTLPPRNPHPPLTSLDLPRPGFLGGDIYAVEKYICDALDKLDELKFDLTDEEYTTRKQTLARDRSFARIALGKSYDCSFEEYFEDKCFVDPLDPTQGEDAIPLCERGDRISVTIDNVREWTALAKKFFLYDGVIAQALSFRRGVSDFFSADALRLFTAEELQRDVCGGGDNVDNWDEKAIRSLFKLDGGKGAAEALVAVAAMGGEGGAALSRRFGPSSPTVGYLVKALLGASSTQRRQFLSFVTSVPIVTPGQIEVVPVVNPAGEFLPMSDPGCLPRANTCSRRLYLPKFESYESFSQVLWAVVREESKFKGFYEWRG